MTEAEKIAMLQTITGETEQTVLTTYLTIAASKVVSRLYPFGTKDTTVPDRYAVQQVQIAAYLLNKRGAEGQVSHSENGISVSFEAGDVPPTLLREIVPMVGSMTEKPSDNEVSDDESNAP